MSDDPTRPPEAAASTFEAPSGVLDELSRGGTEFCCTAGPGASGEAEL